MQPSICFLIFLPLFLLLYNWRATYMMKWDHTGVRFLPAQCLALSRPLRAKFPSLPFPHGTWPLWGSVLSWLTTLDPVRVCGQGESLGGRRAWLSSDPYRCLSGAAACRVGLWDPGGPTWKAATRGKMVRAPPGRVCIAGWVRGQWGGSEAAEAPQGSSETSSDKIAHPTASSLLFLINSMNPSGSLRSLWKEAWRCGRLSSLTVGWLIKQSCLVFWHGTLWIFKERIETFHTTQGLCFQTPELPGGRYLHSSFPSKWENKNAAGRKLPGTMEALTSFVIFKAWSENSSENGANSPCVHLGHWTKTEKEPLSLKWNTLSLGCFAVWEPCCGGSCSKSCGNSRDPGNHQSQEETPAKTKAKRGPSTLAPGWGDFQKLSRAEAALPEFPELSLPSGRGTQHNLWVWKKTPAHVTVRIPFRATVTSRLLKTGFKSSETTPVETAIFQLKYSFFHGRLVSNSSLLLLEFIIQNHLNQKFDFDQSTTSKGSTVFILPLFSKNAITHPTYHSSNKYVCTHLAHFLGDQAKNRVM